jgi:hypothetical protein
MCIVVEQLFGSACKILFLRVIPQIRHKVRSLAQSLASGCKLKVRPPYVLSS